MPDRPGRETIPDQIADIYEKLRGIQPTTLVIQGVADQVKTEISFGSPAPSAMGDAESAGTGTGVARADHVHDRQDDAIMFWMAVAP